MEQLFDNHPITKREITKNDVRKPSEKTHSPLPPFTHFEGNMGLFDEGERPMGVRIPSESHSRPAFQRREADAQINGAPENHVDFESQLETPRFRILQVHEEIQLLG